MVALGAQLTQCLVRDLAQQRQRWFCKATDQRSAEQRHAVRACVRVCVRACVLVLVWCHTTHPHSEGDLAQG